MSWGSNGQTRPALQTLTKHASLQRCLSGTAREAHSSAVAAACYALKSLLGQLRKVFGRIDFKLLDAGFAAEFDLLTFIDLGDRLAHAAEWFA